MVDRAEADAKSADFVRLFPLLTEPSTSDSSPVFIGELGVVVNKERTILDKRTVQIKERKLHYEATHRNLLRWPKQNDGGLTSFNFLAIERGSFELQMGHMFCTKSQRYPQKACPFVYLHPAYVILASDRSHDLLSGVAGRIQNKPDFWSPGVLSILKHLLNMFFSLWSEYQGY